MAQPVQLGDPLVQDLTAGWRLLAQRAVLHALDGRTRVAVLDCPDYGNVGDSLIGIGQFALLDQAGVHIVHASSLQDFDGEAVRRRLGPRGALLIQGGGNFGDLWPHHQRFREDLVRAFPEHRIVQLPQSVYFEDEAQARRSAALLRAHRQFVVLCRDDESLARARMLGLDARMCPDMALVLAPFATHAQTEYDVVMVRRQDKEGVDSASVALPSSWLVQDWTQDLPEAQRPRRIANALRRYLPGRMHAPLGVWSFRRAFEARVQSGLALVRRGRVVVTDRLHVHVLCCLAGRQHAFVDNSYGKVSALWRAWTHAIPFARPCATWDEAVEWAVHTVATEGRR